MIVTYINKENPLIRISSKICPKTADLEELIEVSEEFLSLHDDDQNLICDLIDDQVEKILNDKTIKVDLTYAIFEITA